MEHAKKLMLVEPRLLEELQMQREYKELEKPAVKKKRVAMSLNLRDVLKKDVPDDIKVKEYQQGFSRFINTKDKLPSSVAGKINWETFERPAPPSPDRTPSPVPTRSRPRRRKETSARMQQALETLTRRSKKKSLRPISYWIPY